MNKLAWTTLSILLLFAFSVNASTKLEPKSVKELSSALLVAYNETTPDDVAHLFDQDLFWQRAKESLPKKTDASNDLESAARESMKGLPGVLKRKTGKTSRWKLLRQQNGKRSGQTELLVRINGEEEFHYWRLLVQKKAGNYRIIDWYDHRSSSWYSAYAAETLAFIFAEYSHFNTMKNALLEGAEGSVLGFLTAIGKDNYKKAGTIWPQLPKEVTNSPAMMMIYLDGLRASDYDAWLEQSAVFAKKFGKNKRYWTYLIEYYMDAKKYSPALKAVSYLSKQVNDDFAKYYLSGVIRGEQKKYDQSIKLLRKSLQVEREFQHTYWVLLDVLVYGGRFEDASFLLTLIEKRYDFDFDLEKLPKVPGYNKFAESKPFKKWKKARS